ncbi:MAG: hypothetical protein ACK5Y6_09380 [Pseudomonadota bacterium]|jgi:hypothetical protein
MKRLVLCLFAVVGMGVSLAEAQLSAVCPTVYNLNERSGIGALIQYKNNQVQRSGGVGTPLAGFLRQPTIIATQGRNPFRLGRASIYDSKGKLVCTSAPRQGCATSRGECLARYKFPCSTTAVRRATGNGAFVKVAQNMCVRIPNAGKCYNVKVRDLCDGRTL